MQCLIAVDGISARDLSSLFEHLPNSRKLLEGLRETTVSSSSSSTQAAWAELLTGSNIFLNGCAGYAYPDASLNKLSVFTESNLLASPQLVGVSSEAVSVAINLPILLPKPANRIWLSDGSLPINRLFSPPQLRSEEIFQQYLPRPYKSHAGATTLAQASVLEQCLEVEILRLACAVSLFKRKNWSRFVYRLTIFDYLFHLIGMNFLAADDLSVFGALKKFLAEFDSTIQLFSSEENVSFSLLSAYSHVPCIGTLNLNVLLANGGFLKLASGETSSRTQTERMKVVSALWQPTTHHLTSLEGRLDTSQTVAASPVSGCVYINKSSVFDDGIIDEGDYKRVRSEVSTYLRKILHPRFGQAFSIEVHPGDLNDTIAPDLIVKIDGVEFQNLGESMVPVTPLTTHRARGFALLPEGLQASDHMSATQLASLLND